MSKVATTRKKIDSHAVAIRSNLSIHPQKGWIRNIREALAMTQAELAKKLGVNQKTIHSLELNEINEKIQIGTLKKLAEAMNCDFHYTFIPRKSLEETYIEQAKKNAVDHLTRIENTMALERQSMKFSKSRLEEIIEELIKTERVKW
ncbi:MAG: mobile mystery protein A [Candidatus Nanopelagicaceae bacterium]